MKRGKDDEKMMSPMFPRLHVNDTEKGGPRAPPRNKMALYEQLSIPSQRFSYGMLPSNPNNSSTQGSDSKRAMFFPLHLSRLTQQANNSNATSSDFNPSLAKNQKKLDEEDFAVPIFVQPENGQIQINSDSMDQENLSLSNPAHINRSVINQSSYSKEQKKSSAIFSNLGPKERCQMKKTQGPPTQLEESEDQEVRDHLTNNFDRSISYAARHDFDDRSRLQNSRENREQRDQRTGHSLEIQNVDILDDGSDTSMVDSASGLDIRPDDVVGIIGHKHFWKARKAIVRTYSEC